jgi:hypothetical protein
VFPDFVEDTRFDPSWWRDGSAMSPVTYCRFLDHDEEVGRAKILPESRSYDGYTSWSCPAAGVTEIDRIEIRPDLRRAPKSYGRQVVAAISQAYGEPLVALSLDETSDGFWSALGWTAHAHQNGEGFSTLFTSV